MGKNSASTNLAQLIVCVIYFPCKNFFMGFQSFITSGKVSLKLPMSSLPRELLIATLNSGKLRELESLLSSLPFRVCDLSEFPGIRPVEENGKSFRENAMLKAVGYARQTGLLTLADDSGLEVDALGGAPGILSARYAGEEASDEERNLKLLGEIARSNNENRGARFVCAIAVADERASLMNVLLGVCEGRIAERAHGKNGFGYDPVFIPKGFNKTFGELPDVVKAQISHRARALKQARDFLTKHFRLKA